MVHLQVQAGLRYQFVDSGAENALGSGFLRALERRGIRPGTPDLKH